MRIKRNYTTRYPIDLATVVVVFLWTSIWLLWLSVDDAYIYSDDYRSCVVTYIESDQSCLSGYSYPEPFPSVSLDMIDDEMDVDDGTSLQPVLRAKLLTRLNGKSQDNVAGYGGYLYRLAETAGFDYYPQWSNSAVRVESYKFGSKTVLIQESPRLKKFGYNIPTHAKEELINRDASWEIKAYVEMNKQGQTDHVFLLSCSADESIKSGVERMLYQGTLLVTGAECSGEVVVSFTGDK